MVTKFFDCGQAQLQQLGSRSDGVRKRVRHVSSQYYLFFQQLIGFEITQIIRDVNVSTGTEYLDGIPLRAVIEKCGRSEVDGGALN